jgi:hypothetical protein
MVLKKGRNWSMVQHIVDLWAWLKQNGCFSLAALEVHLKIETKSKKI